MMYRDLIEDQNVINATNAIQDSMGKSRKQHVFKNIPIKDNLKFEMIRPPSQIFKATFVKDSPYDKISKVVCGYDHLTAVVRIKANESIVFKNTVKGFFSDETNHAVILKDATVFEFVVYFPYPEFSSILFNEKAIYGNHDYIFEFCERVNYESDEETKKDNDTEGKNEQE